MLINTNIKRIVGGGVRYKGSKIYGECSVEWRQKYNYRLCAW